MAFTIEDINVFSHKIENCLNNAVCKQIFTNYLTTVRRRDLLRVLKLWDRADDDLKTNALYMEDDYQDFIERIDDFNQGPLLSINEYSPKLEYVKRECARILNKIRTQFIQYLKLHHVKWFLCCSVCYKINYRRCLCSFLASRPVCTSRKQTLVACVNRIPHSQNITANGLIVIPNAIECSAISSSLACF